MKKLRGKPTADSPGIIIPKGVICPNLRHVEATLYPQAGNFLCDFSLCRKIYVQAFQLDLTPSVFLRYWRGVNTVCDLQRVSVEMRNGKNYWKQQCVFEAWLLSCLLIAKSRLKNQMIRVKKTKTLITLQQEILLISLWVFKKLLQNMSNIGCSSKSLGTIQEQTQQCQRGKRQAYLQEV